MIKTNRSVRSTALQKLEILKDLEMAKKRDHKIMITDQAIEKVPRIEYKEIPECEYDNIQILAREVLEISRDNNDSNEVAITYTLDYDACINKGEEYIGVSLGGEHGVDPLSSTISNHLIKNPNGECVVILLHNHPSLSDFSLSDVQFLLENPTIKLMIVVTNLGSITYLLRTPKYSYESAVKLFNKAVTMHNQADSLKDLQKSADYFLKNCYEAGIIYDNR